MLLSEEQSMTLMRMREQTDRNEALMRTYENMFAHDLYYPQETLEDSGETGNTTGTLGIRFLISIFLFGVFVWYHLDGKQIFGYSTEQAMEVISQDIDLQELSNSVKIKKIP